MRTTSVPGGTGDEGDGGANPGGTDDDKLATDWTTSQVEAEEAATPLIYCLVVGPLNLSPSNISDFGP